MDIRHVDEAAIPNCQLDDIHNVREVTEENAELVELRIVNATLLETEKRLFLKKRQYEILFKDVVALQLQNKILFAKNRDEVRLRLGDNRKKDEEEHMEPLVVTISKAETYNAAMLRALKQAKSVICDLKQTHIKEMEKATSKIEALEQTVTMSNERQSQMKQLFSAYKQKAKANVYNLKKKLDAVTISKDQLSSTVRDPNRQLDMSKFGIKKKDETISTYQQNIKEVINSFKDQATTILANKDKELENYANELLEELRSKRESFTKDVRDQGSSLQNYPRVMDTNDGLKIKIKEETAMSEKLNCDIASLKERNDGLVKKLNDKRQSLEISRRSAAHARGLPLPPVPPAAKRRRESTPVRRHSASLPATATVEATDSN